jgi:hypothetical protein
MGPVKKGNSQSKKEKDKKQHNSNIRIYNLPHSVRACESWMQTALAARWINPNTEVHKLNIIQPVHCFRSHSFTATYAHKEIKSHTYACTLLHVSAIKSP